MLQNKLFFNQSSVSLEILGLPDYSNDENDDQISIISQWKLSIIDKPPIEGNKDHLNSVMKAFYIYSNSLLNNEMSSYESNLIDLEVINLFTHNVLLKSSKPDVEPLNFKIGNSVLSDIVSCFDQFNSSEKVKTLKINFAKSYPNKKNIFNMRKLKFSNILLPPLIALSSISVLSSALIFYYDNVENKEKFSFTYIKKN